MLLSFVLSILSSRAQQPSSVIQVEAPATAPAPQPVLPGAGGETGVTPAPPPAGDTSGN